MTGDGPLRVLLVVKGLGLGGAERLLVDQVCAAPADVRFTVAYIRPDKTHFVARLEAHDAEVMPLRPNGWPVPWPVALARLLRSHRPQVVHAHSPLPAAVSRVLVRLRVAGSGAVPVYTEHNRWSAYRLPTRLLNAATMVLDRQTWTVSDEARSSIAPGRLRARAATLHHGIDLGAVRSAGATGPVPAAEGERTFTFVHVANRRPEKAHEVLLEAFALAAADEPGLRLWLVGQGLDDPAIASLLDTHPHRSRIEVLGYRDDAPALVAAGDALVLSSDHEGLPVAVMEALALGRPVVATKVGGLPEAVTDEVEALLVPPRDPVALAGAMVRLARDPDLARRLGAAARARSDHFDASVAQATQLATYRRLVAG